MIKLDVSSSTMWLAACVSLIKGSIQDMGGSNVVLRNERPREMFMIGHTCLARHRNLLQTQTLGCV